jgi:hypothetical protein
MARLEDGPAEPTTPPAGGPPPPPPPSSSSSAVSVAAARAAAAQDQNEVNVVTALANLYKSMTALSFVLGGQEVQVAVPFHMNPVPPTVPPPRAGRANDAGERVLQGDARDRANVIATLVQPKVLVSETVSLVVAGRGAPAQIQLVTQALLDAGKFSPAPTDAAGVRSMMFRLGIGVDCAGYVMQAAVTAHLLPPYSNTRSILDDNLSNLPSRGFHRVNDYGTARPGDIFVLGPQGGQTSNTIGHRAIVFSQHVAVPAEVPSTIAAQLGASAGPIHVFQVDSSWGAGGVPQNGGVRRQTWLYGESTGKWAWQPPMEPSPQPYKVTNTPYEHAFGTGGFGLYRGRASQ